MKAIRSLSLTLLVVALVAVVVILQEMRSEWRLREAWRQESWLISQMSLVAERTFSLMAMSEVLNDYSPKAEAHHTLERSIHRMNGLKDVREETRKETELSMIWLKAMIEASVSQNAPESYKLMGTYRDLVADAQAKLHSRQAEIDSFLERSRDREARLQMAIFVGLGLVVFANAALLMATRARSVPSREVSEDSIKKAA